MHQSAACDLCHVTVPAILAYLYFFFTLIDQFFIV